MCASNLICIKIITSGWNTSQICVLSHSDVQNPFLKINYAAEEIS